MRSFKTKQDLYSLKLSNGDRVLARLDEAAFFEFYINEEVYSAAGQEVCLLLDVALGASGCEAVVEGVYSVAKVHKMSGGQGNESLMQRAIVDWCLSHPVACPGTMKSITRLYLDGDQTLGLKRHRSTRFFDSRARATKYETSKVVDRIKAESPRCAHNRKK